MGNNKSKTLVYDISQMSDADLEDLKKEMRDMVHHALEVSMAALDKGTLVGCVHDHVIAAIDSDKKIEPCGFCYEVSGVTH